MKSITVSVDEGTYRLARIRAAELDTSISALVRSYLTGLVRDRDSAAASRSKTRETERERRRRLLQEAFEDIRATRGGFKASDNVSREALHRRHAVVGGQ